jgi:oxygen-independent coproporphyrinogen-3 oxidase
MPEPLSLYLHYPFCAKKCEYCDFLSWPAGDTARQAYLDALGCEIAHSGMEQAAVDTIFIGGGTPSLMMPKELDHLMFLLASRFAIQSDAEITMECNPGTADYDKLSAFRSLGINRLSIGVQSFRDDELRLLGRIHTAAEAWECYEAARRAGFANINLDLMSALPGQSFDDYMYSLRAAADLDPEHISAYSLILEDGTPLKAHYEAGRLAKVPEDEEDRRMYHETKAYLAGRGYEKYEISNYAKPGFLCRHNLGYWSGHDYLGLGLGAASLARGVRFRVTEKLPEYLACCQEDTGAAHAASLSEEGKSAASSDEVLPDEVRETDDLLTAVMKTPFLPGLHRDAELLTKEDQMGEFMWLGLRKTKGVSEEDFRNRFGISIDAVFGEILQRHVSNGLLIREGGRIYLSEYGTDISNFVMCDFV